MLMVVLFGWGCGMSRPPGTVGAPGGSNVDGGGEGAILSAGTVPSRSCLTRLEQSPCGIERGRAQVLEAGHWLGCGRWGDLADGALGR
jgi:hypothetical protein